MKNEFCPRWGSNPRPPAFAASVLTARPRGPHGRERTTPRLILKHLEIISPQRHPPDTKGKIWFSQFTLFYRVEYKELFCKTNLKLKLVKLNKTKFNSKPWRHKIENIFTIEFKTIYENIYETIYENKYTKIYDIFQYTKNIYDRI